MNGSQFKKIAMSVVASTMLMGAFTNVDAVCIPTELISDVTTAAASLNACGTTIAPNVTLTITDGLMNGRVEGTGDGVGTVIIDGNVDTNSKYLGDLSSGTSLNKLIIEENSSLTSSWYISATSISIGGTVNANDNSASLSGAIDGISNDTGILNINANFDTVGVIGGTNALEQINIAATLSVEHDISANQISLTNIPSTSIIRCDSPATITANIVADAYGNGRIETYANVVLIGSIGTLEQRVGYLWTYNSETTTTLGGDVFNNTVYVDSFSADNSVIIDASASHIGNGESVTVISASSNFYISSSGEILDVTDTAMIDYNTTVTEGPDGGVVVSAEYKSGFLPAIYHLLF